MRFPTALLFLLMATGVHAAEAPPAEESGEAPAAGEQAEAEAGDAEAAGAARSGGAEDEPARGEGNVAVTSDDTFVPSVQISEDLSVSFPVDI